MSLSERNRSTLHTGLVDVLGDEEAVAEMLSYFPSRDVEGPVTKEFFRAEMAVSQAEVQAEFAAVRQEMAELGISLRGEMASEFAAVRGEMAEFGSGLRSEMHAGFNRQLTWTVTTMIAINTMLVAAIALLT